MQVFMNGGGKFYIAETADHPGDSTYPIGDPERLAVLKEGEDPISFEELEERVRLLRNPPQE